MSDFAPVELPLPKGFRAAAVASGIKKSGAVDLVTIISDEPAVTAGTLTRNRVNAAPVKLCRERLASGRPMRAVVINSGNANACTGAPGLADAHRTAELAAGALGVTAEEVLVCSTGSIGPRLPMACIESALPSLIAAAHPGGGGAAAVGILTTDTVAKIQTCTLSAGGVEVRISALCKGAGMIRPDMATMLCYILTDAAVAREALQEALSNAVRQSFNRITVDADMSTNDTVLCMANGASGAPVLDAAHPDWPGFVAALQNLTMALALQIVDDGEGAKRRANIRVTGALDDVQADRAARAVADSFLVKTGWAGGRPVWGRVMDALGYCGIEIDELGVDIDYSGVPAVRQGVAADTPPDELAKVLTQRVFDLAISLNVGKGEALVYTCDCTEEYVRINMV